MGAAVLWVGLTTSVSAVQIVLDYTYDTNHFFPIGSQARNTLESAAGFYTNLLQNNLSPIQTPSPLNSQFFNGVYAWHWELSFNHPGNGSLVTLNNPTIAADEYRIYVGGRSLPGNTLGLGGPGGYQWWTNASGGFTQEEIDQIVATNATFESQIESRGQANGIFANWGGVLTFDNDPGTNWNFSYNTLPSADQSDFLSVALHELGHAIGLGGSNEWMALTGLINGVPHFFGQQAQSAHGGPVRLEGDRVHWFEGTLSTVYGTSVVQEAAMDPTILLGTRKLMTNLDVASMGDIGWVIPEPALFSLLMLGSSGLVLTRRRAA